MRGYVWLRDSMVKFESDRTALEVVNWNRWMPCYLNRQLITLLSTLGVPDQVFVDLQVRAQAGTVSRVRGCPY